MEHKTDEVPGKYAVGASVEESSVENAREMMGWTEQPTIVVEAPRKVVVRRGGKMEEHEEPAWVKFSTDFKTELADLNEFSLKVFIYIGLSVNFETGTAFPGFRKIATDTKMDKDTVAKAVSDLETRGFLTIEKRLGNSNIYKPMRYISIGRGVPSGGTPDTVDTPRTPEVSPEAPEVSLEAQKVSLEGRVNLHNQINKNQQDGEKERIWNAISENLKNEVATDRFQQMILGAVPVSYENGVLVVMEPDEFSLEWAEQRMGPMIKRMMVGILNRSDTDIRFVVAEEVPA